MYLTGKSNYANIYTPFTCSELNSTRQHCQGQQFSSKVLVRTTSSTSKEMVHWGSRFFGGGTRGSIFEIAVSANSTLNWFLLFWTVHGAPAKFNFTRNQFSEVYFFHVKFLKDFSAKSPEKFHKLMADIFAAIQDLMQHKSSATDAEADALAFLDLDGMDED
ncbi:uncharacterized protein EDB93DRAFT_1102990 [Suillus bovinus]|uniref:uncharacterized protein n=1 Tax=Suillus bovinus TaxID=48563 RepID=UPI001B87E8DD|nr:uncharacterized protein EDB93DRAFT_1102990 [Suillus bovinus]KAG2152679.1 hypothetical protein EDB93DRAFT_1102990 [Suillus bovinus]